MSSGEEAKCIIFLLHEFTSGVLNRNIVISGHFSDMSQLDTQYVTRKKIEADKDVTQKETCGSELFLQKQAQTHGHTVCEQIYLKNSTHVKSAEATVWKMFTLAQLDGTAVQSGRQMLLLRIIIPPNSSFFSCITEQKPLKHT